MNINDLTIGQLKEINSMCGMTDIGNKTIHPMVGRRCLIRTYTAGVHIGEVVSVDGMEVHLKNALRLWKWTGGGLSLSAVANNGIKGGRLNFTGEVFLTNAIELIPTTTQAEVSYAKFIEDKK